MTFRLATWNVEWFDRLFADDGTLELSDERSARYGVTRGRQARAVARVMARIDADAMLVVEAPDTSRRRSGVAALEGFATWAGLRTRRAMLGFANDTRQEIALLYDPDRVRPRHAPGTHARAPRFDGTFDADLGSGLRAKGLVWSKPPLEVDLETPVGALHLIGVHAKSKSVASAETPAAAARLAVANRKKQLAQCAWLRRRCDARLAEGRDLIVMGDLNDGPGLDTHEVPFGRSGVEVVMGSGPDALFDPAATARPRPATARFWNEATRQHVAALVDFAMVSPSLRSGARWRILHPEDDARAAADPDLRAALLDASDHFPVRLDLARAGDHL